MSDVQLVLDTNVVSYLMRGGPLSETYARLVQGKLLAISFITVGEMYFGAEDGDWGEAKRQRLESTLRNFVVIPYDHEIARCYGRLVAERKRNGRPVAPNDAWIVACASRHGIPVVTHNGKDFDGITALRVITARPV